jgi:hypothetical protein
MGRVAEGHHPRTVPRPHVAALTLPHDREDELALAHEERGGAVEAREDVLAKANGHQRAARVGRDAVAEGHRVGQFQRLLVVEGLTGAGGEEDEGRVDGGWRRHGMRGNSARCSLTWFMSRTCGTRK